MNEEKIHVSITYGLAVIRPEFSSRIISPPPIPLWRRILWMLPSAGGIAFVAAFIFAFFVVHPEVLVYAAPAFGFSFAFALVMGSRR